MGPEAPVTRVVFKENNVLGVHWTSCQEIIPKQRANKQQTRLHGCKSTVLGHKEECKRWWDAASAVHSDKITSVMWSVPNGHAMKAKYRLRLGGEVPEVVGRPSQTFPKLVKYQRLMVLQQPLVKHQVLASSPVDHKDGRHYKRTLTWRWNLWEVCNADHKHLVM